MSANCKSQDDVRQSWYRKDLLRVVAQQLNAPGQSEASGSGKQMASLAFLSRSHFQRVFRNTLGETPYVMRRRLLLERAAFDLRSTSKSVRDIGHEAGYQSLGGFSRAFRQLFALSPSAYRRAARAVRWLPGRSGIHYDPRKREAICHLVRGKQNMDLMDRLLESEYISKTRIFACARLLSDSQLDAPLAFRHNLGRFVEPPRTLRELMWPSLSGEAGWIDVMLDRVGWQPEDDSYRRIDGRSVEGMAQRFELFFQTYRSFLNKVRAENLWDQEWVDDTCESPETFSIGQVIEESMASDIVQRRVLERQLEALGFQLHEMNAAM